MLVGPFYIRVRFFSFFFYKIPFDFRVLLLLVACCFKGLRKNECKFFWSSEEWLAFSDSLPKIAINDGLCSHFIIDNIRSDIKKKNGNVDYVYIDLDDNVPFSSNIFSICRIEAYFVPFYTLFA